MDILWGVLDDLSGLDAIQNIIDRDIALTQSFESVLRDHNIIHILTQKEIRISIVIIDSPVLYASYLIL